MGYRPCIGSCPGQVTTILLDDLLEVLTFDRAIIKIDSQGYEHKAFQHANKLLDTVFVPYIYMEWLLMKVKNSFSLQCFVASCELPSNKLHVCCEKSKTTELCCVGTPATTHSVVRCEFRQQFLLV